MANHYPDLQNCGWEWLSWGNWWLSRGKFLTLQLNPAMRGASKEQHRVLGGSFTYGKAFTYALFLGYSKPEKFWICNQGWSNCRCPLGTFMCFLLRHCRRFKEDYAYSYYAGWFYHCSFCCNGSLRASNSGMSRVWLPLFFLYDIKTAIMESDGCESDRPMITKRPFSVYYGR